MGLEFLVKPSSEAGRARGNGLANGSIARQRFGFLVHRRLVPAYRLRAKRENGCGCNKPGTLRAFDGAIQSVRYVFTMGSHQPIHLLPIMPHSVTDGASGGPAAGPGGAVELDLMVRDSWHPV